MAPELVLAEGNPPVEQLEAYMAARGLPPGPVAIAPGSVVVEAEKFIFTHLLNVKNELMPRHNRWLFYRRLWRIAGPCNERVVSCRGATFFF